MTLPVNQNRQSKVDRWWALAGRWLCPPRCPVCREPADPASGLCDACEALLPWNRHACPACAIPLPCNGDPAAPAPVCGQCLQRRSPLTLVAAGLVYGFPVDRLLPRFKFHRDLACGRILAGTMIDSLADAPRPGAIVAVPLHPARLRQRGYDQALELARPVARALGLPLLREVLQRTRPTTAQTRLDAVERRRNLKAAFAVTPGTPLPGHVALVDDVMTTGATLESAARTLRRAGIARVDAWVCARTPWQRGPVGGNGVNVG